MKQLSHSISFLALLFAFLIFSSCSKDEPIAEIPLKNPNLTIDELESYEFQLVWPRVPNATHYVIDLSEDEQFSTFVTPYENFETADNVIVITGLKELTTYYVRAKASNDKESSNYSETSETKTLFGGSAVEISTEDNLTLRGTIRIPEGNSPFPIIVFCHSAGSSEKEWRSNPILTELYSEGIGILTFDNRSHGKSDNHPDVPKDNIGSLLSDPEGIPLDIVAVHNYIQTLPDIDASRIGIVGSSMGANLACIGKGNLDLSYKLAVSMSPSAERVANLNSNIPNFKLRGIYYLAASNDGDREIQSKDLYNLTSNPREVVIIDGSDSHGSAIYIDHPLTRPNVIEWILEIL